jgi:hypothetical protein
MLTSGTTIKTIFNKLMIAFPGSLSSWNIAIVIANKSNV